jgi:uncharacterized membrane protein YfcA
MFGVSLNEVILLATAILVGGVVAGVLAGLFGVGGGVVVVPVLYEIFRVLGVPEAVHMQLCIGTSLAVMVPTSIRSYLTHRAKGAVLQDVVRRWTPPTVVGIAVGSVIATFAPGAVFKIAFVTMAAIIATKMLFGKESWRLGDDLPKHDAAYGLAVGLMASLTGVSGGSLCTMVLTLYGKPIHNAVATSAGLVVPITLAGTLGYVLAGLPQQALTPPLSIGFVSLIGFALMAPVSSVTASYGARIAHAVGKRALEIAFGVFLSAASLRLLASLVW